MGSASEVLSVRELSKTFGVQKVLRRVSLSCNAREVVFIVGANGAGKSTLLRVIAGLARPDVGSVRSPLNGLSKGNTRGRIGFASHHLFLYGRLTVRENVHLFARVAGDTDEHVDHLLRLWGLSEIAERSVADVSKGNQAKVSLARAFLGEPSLLLLDEPSSNLDERGTMILKDCIRKHQESVCGLTLLATHDIHRLRDLATRVVVMDKGAVLADSGPFASYDTIEGVIAQYRETNR